MIKKAAKGIMKKNIKIKTKQSKTKQKIKKFILIFQNKQLIFLKEISYCIP